MPLITRCDFCKTILLDRIYRTIVKSNIYQSGMRTYKCCSDCKFIMEMVRERIPSDGFTPIKNIIKAVLRTMRH